MADSPDFDSWLNVKTTRQLNLKLRLLFMSDESKNTAGYDKIAVGLLTGNLAAVSRLLENKDLVLGTPLFGRLLS